MRALVLLLLGGGLIWAVLTFFPQSKEEGGPNPDEVVAAEPDGASADLAAESDVPKAQPRLTPEPKVAREPIAAPIDDTPAGSGFAVPVNREDLIEIGFLVSHSSPSAVADWLDVSDELLGADRDAAVRAFSLAASGDRSGAREEAKNISSAEKLPGRIRWALQRLLAGDFSTGWPPNIKGGDPLELGMLQRLGVIEAGALAAQRKEPLAAKRLTDVFLTELNAPWAADPDSLNAWRSLMQKIQSRHRWSAKGSWPSVEVVVQPGDSLAAIRKRYVAEYPDRLICTGLIAKANGIQRDLIHPDDVLRIPTEPVSLLADLDAHWVLYFHGDEVVAAYPVGIGAEGNETIVGHFEIGEKLEEPTWFRRNEPPIVYGEEGNPLGTRYMTWFQDGTKTHFGFHGTWEPETIGLNKSQGCIRMRNADVEELFSITPLHSEFDVQP